MTIRRRRLWFVLIAGVALMGGAWWSSGHTFWVKSGRNIAKGMSFEQVEVTIGKHPDFTRDFGGRYLARWDARSVNYAVV